MALLDVMRQDPGQRASATGLIVNVLLAIVKFSVGISAGSAALVADAFNSAGDIVASGIGWTGYALAQQPPDENHHYGHGKFESVAGLIIGGMLLATGLFVSIDGVRALLRGTTEAPGLLAAVVAFGTAGVKEALYRYVYGVGSELNSPSLLASAKDHRADVFMALTVVGGVLGARFAVPWLDPATAVLIGLFIAWMAVEPIQDNARVLLDEAPPELQERIRLVALEVDGVGDADGVRIHPSGAHLFVDVEIYVDGAQSLHTAHELAHLVRDRVAAEIPDVRDVVVHVNPTEGTD